MKLAPHVRESELIEAARRAHERAYAPYSGFSVGAAVLGGGGGIYSGCNVENASYGATVCAERNAVAAAVLAGERSLLVCVVYTVVGLATPPCGVCRQVLYELGRGSVVVSVSGAGAIERWSLDSLLPHAFGPDHLA